MTLHFSYHRNPIAPDYTPADPWIWYYSDDVNVDDDGDPLGTAENDNTFLLNKRRFLYQLVGDESAECSQNFEPTPEKGTVEWSDWDNYGCRDTSLPMTRTTVFPRCIRPKKCDRQNSINVMSNHF